MTPLHWATFNGDYDMVKLLIDLGAEVLKQKVEGYTAFHLAANNCDIHTLE